MSVFVSVNLCCTSNYLNSDNDLLWPGRLARKTRLTCSIVAPEARLTEGARSHPRGDLVGPRGTRATRHLTSAAENVNIAYNNRFL